MTLLHYNQARFLTSAPNLSHCPDDSGYEVAFVGRSNVGKSSVINTLANVKQLARVAKTPGRTQLINFFSVAPTYRLVDLPGYGYAKVSKQLQGNWQKAMTDYLQLRRSLEGLILIMDIRHPLKAMDQTLLEVVWERQLRIHIVLNKQDKLKRGQINATMQKMSQQLQKFHPLVTIQSFSCFNKTGLDELKDNVTHMLLKK